MFKRLDPKSKQRRNGVLEAEDLLEDHGIVQMIRTTHPNSLRPQRSRKPII